jgi:phosphoribosylpyrophosphate synthetase
MNRIELETDIVFVADNDGSLRRARVVATDGEIVVLIERRERRRAKSNEQTSQTLPVLA